MTIFVTSQLRAPLDSICNACDVFTYKCSIEQEENFIESLKSQPGGASMLRQPLLRAPSCQRSRRLSKAGRATAQPGKKTILLNLATLSPRLIFIVSGFILSRFLS